MGSKPPSPKRPNSQSGMGEGESRCWAHRSRSSAEGSSHARSSQSSLISIPGLTPKIKHSEVWSEDLCAKAAAYASLHWRPSTNPFPGNTSDHVQILFQRLVGTPLDVSVSMARLMVLAMLPILQNFWARAKGCALNRPISGWPMSLYFDAIESSILPTNLSEDTVT